ncbi:hypothetical protein BDZ85DRAFT_268818 [Elsinoe ampelina]|uniref:Uncharacterized protein n=1 Tax=Elsinoe ampelina TaxID=302913 RepID=A0A6A6G0T7_9PEZI|nr:hypothetical protein BDZ85DRAFT_268818 [Elsinoe ampelina]
MARDCGLVFGGWFGVEFGFGFVWVMSLVMRIREIVIYALCAGQHPRWWCDMSIRDG